MKLKVYHVYFMIIGLGGLVGGLVDYSFPTNIHGIMTNGWEGVGYGLGVTSIYGGILVVFYYVMVFYYKKQKTKKSYI